MAAARNAHSTNELQRFEGLGLHILLLSRLHGKEINLDLFCTPKPRVLPLMAGERVVGHLRLSARRDCDVVDA